MNDCSAPLVEKVKVGFPFRASGVVLPQGFPKVHAEAAEIGWLLHGAISHLAIRRHVYFNDNPTPAHTVIALQVRAFLASVPVLLPALAAAPVLAAAPASAAAQG